MHQLLKKAAALFTTRPRKHRPTRRLPTRLCCEILEDRCLLNAGSEVWTNSTGDGNWNTDNNWLTNHRPIATDFVTIPLLGSPNASPHVLNGETAVAHTVTVQGGATLFVDAGGSLTVGSTLTTMGANDLVSVSGVLSVSGSIVLGGSLNTTAGGMLDLQVGQTISGAGTLTNAGTIQLVGGPGISSISAALTTNDGAIDVGAGQTVNLTGNDAGGGGGSFAVDGTINLSPTTSWAGNWSATGAGSVIYSTGTLVLLSSTVFDFTNTGGFQVNATAAVTIDPPPPLVTLTNNGLMVFTGTAPITVSNIDLVNNGTIQVTATTDPLFSNTDLKNNAGALLDFQSNAGIQVPPPGVGTTLPIFNNGTLQKSAGSGISNVGMPIINNGTVQVSSGELDLSGDVANILSPNSTLTGGTWNVLNGSTLQFLPYPLFNPINVMTTFIPQFVMNNAAVILLSGVGASLPQLLNLTGNSGSLSLLNGAALLATSGSFANSGALTVGTSAAAGSKLVIAGTFTQSSTGSLAVQVGGAPASGLFGQIDVSGTATLGGTAAASAVNGYGPQPGQAFSVVTYASEVGSFSSTATSPFTNATTPIAFVLNPGSFVPPIVGPSSSFPSSGNSSSSSSPGSLPPSLPPPVSFFFPPSGPTTGPMTSTSNTGTLAFDVTASMSLVGPNGAEVSTTVSVSTEEGTTVAFVTVEEETPESQLLNPPRAALLVVLLQAGPTGGGSGGEAVTTTSKASPVFEFRPVDPSGTRITAAEVTQGVVQDLQAFQFNVVLQSNKLAVGLAATANDLPPLLGNDLVRVNGGTSDALVKPPVELAVIVAEGASALKSSNSLNDGTMSVFQVEAILTGRGSDLAVDVEVPETEQPAKPAVPPVLPGMGAVPQPGPVPEKTSDAGPTGWRGWLAGLALVVGNAVCFGALHPRRRDDESDRASGGR